MSKTEDRQPRSGRSAFRRFWSTSRTRLREELVPFERDIKRRVQKVTNDTERDALECVDGHLSDVRAELRWGSTSVGFASLNAAKRCALHSAQPAELEAHVIDVRSEAEEKLDNWRRNAVAAHLATADSTNLPNQDTQRAAKQAQSVQSSEDPRRVLIEAATKILDEGLQNDHRKNDEMARRFWHLLFAIGVAVVALLALSKWGPLDMSATAGTEVGDAPMAGSFPESLSLWLHVLAFGVLGGAVSAGARLIIDRAGLRIPEIRAQTVPVIFRPAFGGAAAMGAVAVLAGGLFTTLSWTNGAVMAIAFLSGFTERLLDNVARRVADVES